MTIEASARSYDLQLGRILVDRRRSELDQATTPSTIQAGYIVSLRRVLDLIETSHQRLTIGEMHTQRLWQLYDDIEHQLDRAGILYQMRQDVLAENDSTSKSPTA